MSAAERQPCCGSCAHFFNDPHRLERSFPGWRALGSAFGSARAEDGVCELRGVYLSALRWCRDHANIPEIDQTQSAAR